MLLARALQDAPPFTAHRASTSPRAFASQASVALELVAARQVQEQLLLVEERDRIARDLHDHVVQRLFATGLSLQQVVQPAGGRQPGAGRRRDDRDRRDHPADPQHDPDAALGRRRVGDPGRHDHRHRARRPSAAARASRRSWRSTPARATVTGPLAADLAACVREALSNVVRHAHASQVDHQGRSCTSVSSTLSVADDGVGIDSTRRSGLGNLAKRAEQPRRLPRVSTAAPGQGTTLTWRVPVVRLSG